MKLYTIDNQFIKETNDYPNKFTGIAVYGDGQKYWWFESKIHRLDGPAIEDYDGTKEWYIYGKRHRLDGPAVEYHNGTKSWFVNGKQITEKECNLLYLMMKLKGLL